MKTYIVFSSKEPLLIMTRESIHDTDALAHLHRRGLMKFIAREVPTEQVRQRYGYRFEIIEDSLYQGKGCRVLDYSGEQVMKFISFSNLGPAIYLGSGSTPRKGTSSNVCIARGKRVQANAAYADEPGRVIDATRAGRVLPTATEKGTHQ